MKKPAEVEKILIAILNLEDDSDLEKIQSAAKGRRRHFRDIEGDKTDWQYQQNVILKLKYQNRKPYNTVGVIIKINPKTLKINFDKFGIYNVSKGMVKPTEMEI